MEKVRITYCKPCGYGKRAQRLASALRAVGLDAELVAGKGGIFEVAIGGKVVAQKTRAGFPTGERPASTASTRSPIP